MAQTQDDVKQRSSGSNSTSVDGVKVRSPKPNRRSSSLLSQEKNGRQARPSLGLKVNNQFRLFQANESQDSYCGPGTDWEILHHQKILRKKICCEIFANSGNRLWCHQDICGQKRGININLWHSTQIFSFCFQVSVHIFDTSGASLFTDVRNEFYREAHGLLMVMDVTRRESFEDLSDWVLEIKQEVWKLPCISIWRHGKHV